ncbi:MAG: glycoside hydrolase family 127 protein [Armatimonadota bacterium]
MLTTAALALAAISTPPGLAASGHRKLDPVPFTKVRLSDGFWAPRMETNAKVTLAHQIRMCENTGRFRNFAVAAGLEEGDYEGLVFNDSDTYKLLEGASYCLANERDPEVRREIEAEMDRIIDLVGAAQQADGYLNTFYTIREPDRRWTNLPRNHELYCAGHLFEAAAAHYEATGSRKLLDIAVRFADHIDQRFGPGKDERVPGHEEIELGLIKLFRVTGDQRYFDLAAHFIDARGGSGAEYCQDHKPVREQDAIVGHAVRAMYLYAAVADVVAATGDEDLLAACDRIWEDTTTRKAYITGGVGASAHNEGFTTPYDLPNDSAYAETCAACGLAFWAQRMLALRGTSEYADVLERVLYNGFASGVSLSGDRFFYVNPLASRGKHRRSEWFGCACCPPNVLRTMASVGGYFYGTSPDSLWVHLYAAGSADVELGGRRVTVEQRTDYPWDGDVRLRLSLDAPSEFELALRVPAWCEGASYKVGSGRTKAAEPSEDGYLHLRRTWRHGDTVLLQLPMAVRRMEANPAVAADVGRVALMRGPIVYCLEAADNEGSVRDLYLPREAELKASYEPGLLGGVVVLRGAARRVVGGSWADELYRRAAVTEQTTIKAVPYCVWDNREPGQMTVWMPECAGLTEAKLAPTAASTAKVTASFIHADISGVNDGILPESSGDYSVPFFDWWPHKGTEEWLAYEFPEPIEVRGVEVYWFDDTGRGQCRLPASWCVEWLDGDTWREVEEASHYGTRPDMLNRVTFAPVTTRALRLRVQLPEGFAAGVQEWRVL